MLTAEVRLCFHVYCKLSQILSLTFRFQAPLAFDRMGFVSEHFSGSGTVIKRVCV